LNPNFKKTSLKQNADPQSFLILRM